MATTVTAPRITTAYPTILGLTHVRVQAFTDPILLRAMEALKHPLFLCRCQMSMVPLGRHLSMITTITQDSLRIGHIHQDFRMGMMRPALVHQIRSKTCMQVRLAHPQIYSSPFEATLRLRNTPRTQLRPFVSQTCS